MTISSKQTEEKVAVSIKDMASACGLSRQRFGQLIKAGVFPAPIRDEASGRPYYTPELQRVCLEVRRRNCGVNGKVVMFYSARTLISATSKSSRPKTTKPKVTTQDRHTDILDGLHGLGLTGATNANINEALAALYPSGTDGVDAGHVLRSVFLHIRGKYSA